MYTLIRLLAPIVLVLFLSTSVFATMLYQEGQYSQDIKYKIYYRGGGTFSDLVYKPKTGDKFTINMKAFYQDREFKEIDLVNAGNMEYLEADHKYGDSVFYLIAPPATGTYLCTFEGTAMDDVKHAFNIPIMIEGQDQVTFIEKSDRFMASIAPYLVMVGIIGFCIAYSSAMKGN